MENVTEILLGVKYDNEGLTTNEIKKKSFLK